jgi:hypothetical protein
LQDEEIFYYKRENYMHKHPLQELNELERREKMQRLNNTSWSVFEDNEQARYFANNPKEPWWVYPLIVGCTMAVSIVLMFSMRTCVKEMNKGELDCSKCHSAELVRKQKLVAYFARKGSPEPERMADAVTRTNSPRLLAAVAIVETGGNSKTKNSGYKKRHHGAFQVNPRHWGEVSQDPVKQALQAEAILEELVEEKGSLRKGLSAYGGDKTRNIYANLILKELQEVPR